MKNERLWIDWNGTFTKITVKPGHPLTMYKRMATDEGWISAGKTFFIEDGRVYEQAATDGRDCDGRLSTYWEGYASATATAFPYYAEDCWFRGELLRLHTWTKVESGQRDYAAEAAGY
jgi:hypothetical protein